MDVIKNYLGWGIIEQVSTRAISINLVAYKLEDILIKIMPVFEENPLITKKYLDFYYFIVSYIMNKKNISLKRVSMKSYLYGN